MVVDECGELFAVVLTDGVLGGIVDVAPDIDKVLEVLAENGVADTRLGSECLDLSILVGHHHLLLGSTGGVSGKIGIAGLLVVTVNGLHHKVLVDNLAQQLSVQVVEVQMVVAIALAGQQDMLVGELDIIEHLFLDVLIYLILDSQLANG